MKENLSLNLRERELKVKQNKSFQNSLNKFLTEIEHQ